MITLEGLFISVIVFLLAYALWRHLGIGQIALSTAKAYTEKQGVILLDQSVHLQKIRLSKGRNSLLDLTRTYKFEFSTRGDKRYLGWIVMTGRKFKSIDLQPYVDELNEVH